MFTDVGPSHQMSLAHNPPTYVNLATAYNTLKRYVLARRILASDEYLANQSVCGYYM